MRCSERFNRVDDPHDALLTEYMTTYQSDRGVEGIKTDTTGMHDENCREIGSRVLEGEGVPVNLAI